MARWAEFEVVTTTPLAMGGAYNRGRQGAEALRSRSVRGLLRTWTRFILGARLDDSGLRDAERFLYGGVHPTPQESLVRCRVLARRPPTNPWGVPELQTEGPHGELADEEVRGRHGRYVKGVRYLGDLSFRPTNNQQARYLVPPDQRFVVGLRCGGNQRQRELLWASVWLLVNLGGAGSRSRRGFGSLRIEGGVPPEASEALPDVDWATSTTPGGLAASLRKSLGSIHALAAGYGPPRRRPGFGTIDHCRVEVADRVFATPAEAQRFLGNTMFEYRHHRNPDTATTLAGGGGVLERPMWGLPLSMPNATLDLAGGGQGSRWPSPLSFGVRRLGPDELVLVATAYDIDPPSIVERDPTRHFTVAVGGKTGAGAAYQLLDQFAAGHLPPLRRAWP